VRKCTVRVGLVFLTDSGAGEGGPGSCRGSWSHLPDAGAGQIPAQAGLAGRAVGGGLGCGHLVRVLAVEGEEEVGAALEQALAQGWGAPALGRHEGTDPASRSRSAQDSVDFR
jgi:hypothetical protein